MKKYHLYVLYIPDSVWWRVRSTDPICEPMAELPSWSVLHPFAYQAILNTIGDAKSSFLLEFGDDFVVSTNRVVFIAEDGPEIALDHETIYKAACLFLRN